MITLQRLDVVWYTDTMDGRLTPTDGNRYAQVLSNKNNFASVWLMDSKSKAGDALRQFCNTFGVHDKLVFNGSKEKNANSTDFMKQLRSNNIEHQKAEPEWHKQNSAEGVIRELQRKWFRIMVRKIVLHLFWDYGIRMVGETMQLTATNSGHAEL